MKGGEIGETVYSKDDQSNYNFRIEITLTAGETVYLKIGGYAGNSYGEYYTLYVNKMG